MTTLIAERQNLVKDHTEVCTKLTQMQRQWTEEKQRSKAVLLKYVCIQFFYKYYIINTT